MNRGRSTHQGVRRLGGVGWALLGLCLASAAAPSRAVPPPAAAAQEATPARLVEARPVDRVLIVSIDGLGPDVLRHSVAPNLRGLMERGAYTLSAITTTTVKTLPSHTSMLTGVSPEKHGVTWNDAFHGYPRFPTLMEVVKRQRPSLTTALVAGKAKFKTFAKPGSLDWSYVPESDAVTDERVTDEAVALIREHRPDVLMVHLPSVDLAGHEYGWGSSEQLAAVARADRDVGRILAALRAQGLLEKTAVFVTADHGGVGHNHVPTDVTSMLIPWIVVGPGVRAGFDLATVASVDQYLQVHIEDTFATASWLLGLAIDPRVDGRAVFEIRPPAARAKEERVAP